MTPVRVAARRHSAPASPRVPGIPPQRSPRDAAPPQGPGAQAERGFSDIPVYSAGPLRLQRNGDPIPVDLVPTSPEEQAKLKQQGIDLPKVSAETWRSIGGVADNAGKTLSALERQKIESLTHETPPAAPVAGFPEGPRFVLHDTAADMARSKLEENKAKGRGPLGEGPAAYIPREGEVVVAHPRFFDPNRPSATEYEQVTDVIDVPTRKATLKKVWATTSGAEHGPAFDRALAGQDLTADEITGQKEIATRQLEGTATKADKDDGWTAASWAVRELCARVTTAGAKAIAASPAQEADVTAACTDLKDYFAKRGPRVASSVNVEILQKPGGNCSPKGEPLPAYTDVQYAGVAGLYLRAAQQAGRFPEVTTHFWLDARTRNRCDPRCFDLQRFYDTVAARLGHGKGSTYGIKPNYGIRWGTHNVWWSEAVCGRKAPS